MAIELFFRNQLLKETKQKMKKVIFVICLVVLIIGGIVIKSIYIPREESNEVLFNSEYISNLKRRSDLVSDNTLYYNFDGPFYGVQELVDRSDVIIMGKVNNISSDEKRNMINVTIEESLKSGLNVSTIDITTIKGNVNGVDYSCVSQGDRYLFFLVKESTNSSAYSLVNYDSSAYEVNKSDNVKELYSAVNGQILDLVELRNEL